MPAGFFLGEYLIKWVIKSSRRGLLGEIFDKLRIQCRMQMFGKKWKSSFDIKFGIYGEAIGANLRESSYREDSHL